MAREISVSSQELQQIEHKLSQEREKLPKEERALLEALLAKANAEKALQPQGGGWTFTWTYRF